MPTNSERTVNIKLAECLRSRLPNWSVGAEQTNVLIEKMKQPDLVVSHTGGLTVIIETEFSPAATVETDTIKRLGQTIQHTGEQVEQCIAVKLPVSLRKIEQEHLDSVIQEARYLYAVFTFDGKEELYGDIERWPSSGWIKGGLNDLANCVETVALSERRVAKGVKILEDGVSRAAGYLQVHAPEYIHSELAEKLHQQQGEQTTRMAMAILANAVIFHMRLALHYQQIKPLAHYRTEHGTIIQSDVLQVWRQILRINYWPIFSLALDVFLILPERDAQRVIDQLEKMSAELERFGAADIQDLSGRMFQQLITDRKFLATFYTLPASATLLAELAVSRLDIDWSNPKKICSLKIADLACGTGALLGATYQSLTSRFRRTGGNDSLLHAKMMESVLTAADIMPSAVHLTAATLSGMHPEKPYGHTQIINMPYGDNGDGNGVSIGSLDLMEADETRDIFGTGRKALTGQGALTDDGKGAVVEVPHGSMDLVIMNPPFTRPTNHEATAVPVPSFAGFSTKKEEQAKMSARLKEIRQHLSDPAGHGNAGLASNFIDLAHAKLRPGGVLALVLPSTFMQGKSWGNARRLLRRHYKDILVVGIATDGNTDRAFSADTGMAEVLVVATRKKDNHKDKSQIFIGNLLCRPKTQLEAFIAGQTIERMRRSISLNHGKILFTEKQHAGNYFRTHNWTGLGIRESSLVNCMNSLTNGQLFLPRMAIPISLPICTLSEMGERGYLHRDINGRTIHGEPRGPFDLEYVSPYPEFPVLWGHDINREHQLIVDPDQQGVSRDGLREQATELWHNGASRLHYNVDFGLNSQRLAACITLKPSLGGRSWPNFLTKEEWEIPLVLWANTTLGLICSWWAGTRQQLGRSILTITRLPQLVSIDARNLSPTQLECSNKIFDEFRNQAFLPANEAYRDDVRISLDHAVFSSVLGIDQESLDHLAILREHWCAEPSVHGGKRTKSQDLI